MIIGRERRGRLSQLAWCGGGCFDSRRRVNSDVRRQVNIHDYERTAVVVLRFANRCDDLQRHTISCDCENGCAQMDNVTQCAVGGLDSSGSYNAPCQLLTLRLPPNKSGMKDEVKHKGVLARRVE